MESNLYSLAIFNIIVPHHTDHPQPTKQKMTVNACDIPTIQFIINDPIRPRALSCCEKRGIPMHKQKNPEKIVPENILKNDYNKFYITSKKMSLTSSWNKNIAQHTKPCKAHWKYRNCTFHH